MSREGHLRRDPRLEKSASVQLVWQNRGGADQFVTGRSLDVSTSGMRVEVAAPIDTQTYVTVQCAALGLHGRASVRTCARSGQKFILGLEFSSGLRWKPKS
jgi:hypothetical protein